MTFGLNTCRERDHMTEITVNMSFENSFRGSLSGQRGQVPIGSSDAGQMAPYELLLGALGACYYSTFLGIAEKMKLQFERAEFTIHGVKRDEVPTTLQEVNMLFTIHGAADQKGFDRAASLAGKYCSIHATLEKVATMHTELRFV